MIQIPKAKKLRYKNLKDFTDSEKITINSLIELVNISIEELEREVRFYDKIGSGYFCDAWIHDGLVIKLSKSGRSAIPKRKDKEYRYFIPTVEVILNESEYNESYECQKKCEGPIRRLIFQKEAELKDRGKNFKYLWNKLKINTKYDIHADNVGKYKGKPILFDC